MSETTQQPDREAPSSDPLLTVEDVAARLSISRRGAYRLFQQHRIGFVRVMGLYRCEESDVKEFIKRNREKPTVTGLRSRAR